MPTTVGTDVFPSGSGVGLNIAAFFKTRYPQREIEKLTEFGHPFYEMVEKSDELTGEATIVPMQLDTPQGISADIQTALTNVSSSFGKKWTITLADLYAGLTIDAKSMLAARNDQGAFFRLKEREVSSILTSLGNYLEMSLWRDGTGSVGQLVADPGTVTTFTLATISDALNFHINMVVKFYDNDGTGNGPGTLRAGGARTISGVNYTTGVITVSAALDAALDISDHVVRDGMLDAGVKGVPAWIPATDPTDTFFGTARTLYPQLLGGWREAWAGSIEETVKNLHAKVQRANQRPKTLWLSYSNFNRLEIELGARAYREDDGSGAKFSRPSLLMTAPGGAVKVIAGPYVPENACYLLDMSTWKIGTLGSLPHMVTDDGLSARVMGVGGATAVDGIEIRFRGFYQLICVNPFANGRAAVV